MEEQSIANTLADITNLQQEIQLTAEDNAAIARVHENHRSGLKNLTQFLKFRSKDRAALQFNLFHLGLSTLEHDQSDMEAALQKCSWILKGLAADAPVEPRTPGDFIEPLEFKREQLFGQHFADRNGRIMVTLPSESAHDFRIIETLITSGMDVARINCAHDTPREWLKMITAIRNAEQKLYRKIKIAMDIGGPKVRTAHVGHQSQIFKCVPKRDELGNTISPFVLTCSCKDELNQCLQVDEQLIANVAVGDKLDYKDARGKKRKLNILWKEVGRIGLECNKTTYFENGSDLNFKNDSYKIHAVPAPDPFIVLNLGDHLVMSKEQILAEGSTDDSTRITTTAPFIIDDVQLEDPIFFDDGKIGGKVIKKDTQQVTIEITNVKVGGGKLRRDKGINLPKTNLSVSGLTPKDMQDMDFICQHADIVNFSFVNSAQDVEDLLEIIAKNDKLDDLGVVLKIETAQAFNRLSEILQSAMKLKKIGVMVARGDLAIEVGWQNLGGVIREIFHICRAAHVPIVWATQVLESLAKKGTPSRSEIVDAIISSQADCIMLNKGPYINQSIALLDSLIREVDHTRKHGFPVYEKLRTL